MMVQQKRLHCGLWLFPLSHAPRSHPGTPWGPLASPRKGPQVPARMLASRARKGRGGGVNRECRGDFAMFVLLRALFSPLRWLDATWLLRSCCRVECVCVCMCVCVFNVRIPANVAQIKFKLEVNRGGGGGGGGGGERGGRLFPFRDSTSSLRGDSHPGTSRVLGPVFPPTPPLLTTRNQATGVGLLTEDAASAF